MILVQGWVVAELVDDQGPAGTVVALDEIVLGEAMNRVFERALIPLEIG